MSWVAIGAIALHTLFAGLNPALSASQAAAFDPLAITCLHQAVADGTAPGLPDAMPAHGCNHCVLCAAGSLAAPADAVNVALRPVQLASTPAPACAATPVSITSKPGNPRAPPMA